jgi:hypothetical protein
MEKVCIFCGGQLGSKTLEHVLPQWLIELTGNPKRMAEFGYKKSEKGQFVKRRFAFNAFKFPSCKECNQKFANLEAGVNVVVQKMMLEDSLSESELSTLLDWFDKVRIGLWLGFLYLDKNPLAISPHFHVQHRIRQHDRMLAIFKAAGNIKGLSFAGCDTPAFAQTPSCFSLRINSLWFFNVSYPNLLARRMGFPFPMETYMMEDGRLDCSFAKGRNRMMRPVLRKPIGIKGTELYQPIFFGNIVDADSEKVKRLYDTKYVRDNCISWEEGIGRIYRKRDSEVAACNTSPSMEWLPEGTHDFKELQFEMQLLTFEWQLYIIKNMKPSVKFLSGETKRQTIKLFNLGEYYNRKMVEILNKVKRY